jgi:hypothetical protein
MMKKVRWSFQMNVRSSKGDQILDFDGEIEVHEDTGPYDIERRAKDAILSIGSARWFEETTATVAARAGALVGS